MVYDVIVVGGGLAGCSTALSLARNAPQTSFVIIDDADDQAFKIGESLPPESLRLLQHLDPSGALTSTFAKTRPFLPSAGNVSAWASSTLEERHAIMNPFGSGFHLERARFDQMLRERVTTLMNNGGDEDKDGDERIGTLLKGKVAGIERMDDGNGWLVRWKKNGESGETGELRAKWIVDATGRKASIATKLGARTITPSPLLAFYALFTTSPDEDTANQDKDKDTRTLIEASSTGWFYTSLVPLSPSDAQKTGCKTGRIVVYHTTPSHPSAKIARRKEGFVDLIMERSTHAASIIEEKGYNMFYSSSSGAGTWPRATAAGSSHLDRVFEEFEGGSGGWVAVGDAACAFDPLAAQGMMSALEGGYIVGNWLAKKLAITIASSVKVAPSQTQTQTQTSKTSDENQVVKFYALLKEQYEGSRRYYYSIVKRFGEDGEEFWGKVQSQSQPQGVAAAPSTTGGVQR